MPKRKFDETVDVPVPISEQCTSLCKSTLSEDGALKFDFKFSLQKIAMAKIITSLWMNGNTKQYVEECRKWYPLRMDFIKNKISALNLPSTFTRTLIKVFESVKESIDDWIWYHDEYVFDGLRETIAIHHVNNIKWNSQGRIDYGQTAKNMIENMDKGFIGFSEEYVGLGEELFDDYKFRIASTYCFEDEISVMGPKVVNKSYIHWFNFRKFPMIHFWAARFIDYMRKIPITYVFTEGMHRLDPRNEVPIRYLWNRLNAEEQSKCISIFTGDFPCRNFICFVLSAMNYEQQRKVFREHSVPILNCMINHWLWEEYFVPTALYVLNIMKPSDCSSIFRVILFKIRDSQVEEKGSCNQYKSMFKLIWGKCSMHMKDCAMKDFCIERQFKLLLCDTYCINVDLIECVLKDFNAERKKEFIIGGDTSFFGNIFLKGGIELADYFMQYCEASVEEINDFKKKLMLSENMKYFEKDILWLVIKWCNPLKETVAE